eukprot:jgi/Galph1/2381/GphlegSOOS_G1078.1
MIDNSITLLYATALESFLFFAVLSQTKSQEPDAHGGIARTFGSLFLVQSSCLLCWATAIQIVGKYNLYIIDKLFSLFFIAGLVAACIGGGYIAVPEPRRKSFRNGVILLCATITILYWLMFSSSLGSALDVPFLEDMTSRSLFAALEGTLLALCFCCVIRIFRPLKGSHGAVILFVGNGIMLLALLFFKILHEKCAGTDDILLDSCPLPTKFDHNSFLLLFLLCCNVFVAEATLRFMAAGNGMESYLEIEPNGRV